MNRLKLNFQLNTPEERTTFLRSYLPTLKNPTPEELETCSNYVLYGKDPTTGKNLVQEKKIFIPTRNKTWDKKEETSLESLLENPSFREEIFTNIQTVTPKIKFSRKEALEEAPSDLKEIFRSLFRQIDTLELILNFYDLAHGKRKTPISPELLERFTAKELVTYEARSQKLNQYSYLKNRHYLVELRRQQYFLRDIYRPISQKESPTPSQYKEEAPRFGDDIPVFPFGIKTNTKPYNKIFTPFREISPLLFTERELKKIYRRVLNPSKEQFYFDFRNEAHIAAFLTYFFDCYIRLEGKDGALTNFFQTFLYYFNNADLTPQQRRVFWLKLKKTPSEKIVEIINKEFNVNYGVNYLSTLFHKKIIKKIAEAARYHEELVYSVCFDEQFKHCSRCGTLLWVHPWNFSHKATIPDGFSNQCKDCDRKDRERKQEAEAAAIQRIMERRKYRAKKQKEEENYK